MVLQRQPEVVAFGKGENQPERSDALSLADNLPANKFLVAPDDEMYSAKCKILSHG